MAWADCLALAKAGRRMATRMEIMLITTNSSINVKPGFESIVCPTVRLLGGMHIQWSISSTFPLTVEHLVRLPEQTDDVKTSTGKPRGILIHDSQQLAMRDSPFVAVMKKSF
jgi:hypothetical protein